MLIFPFLIPFFVFFFMKTFAEIMNTSLSLSFFFFFFFFNLSPSLCEDALDEFKACGVVYNCGNLVNISYPFWGNERLEICGRREFKLNCQDNETTTIEIDSQEYNVLNINKSNQRMTIARSDLFKNYCPENPIQTASLDFHLFNYSSNDRNISVWYNCPSQGQLLESYRFLCNSDARNRERANYVFEEPMQPNLTTNIGDCKLKIEVTVTVKGLEESKENKTALLEKGLREGFDVEYRNLNSIACEECVGTGGKCGSNETYPFYCICQNQNAHPYLCFISAIPAKPNRKRKAIIGVCSGIGGILIMSVIFFIWFRLHKKKHAKSFLLRSGSSDPLKQLEKRDNYMGVPLFTYSELEEATDKFNPSRELGDGGFGTVYYGKLRDGREVAVKRLFDNNYRKVEHFMNEVEILTRLRHKSLVTLYGCTSQHCRELLLVYEFIPNGTVADHLHGNRAKPGELPWLTRLKIAIETASALAYLHASKTIHRDVKTTNILIDNNCSVKVADFGLSRLSPTHATHISTAPQGTPGYVDPEYNECYQLTSKSDVFSFGVVLVELISSKPAVDITRHRHEINLSTMAINKIRNNELHDFVDPSLGFETDYRVKDMICAVAELAFRCLQSVKDTRPPMSEVLEILKDIESRNCGKGKAEEIDISGDVDALLKGGSQPQSPDTDAFPWKTKSSTPNDSG